MNKEFNIEGHCAPGEHYMVDVSSKLEEIFSMVEKGKYFTINRPRQYGKTTILSLLSRLIREKKDYLSIRLSFESMGDAFSQESSFVKGFLQRLRRAFRGTGDQDLLSIMSELSPPTNLIELSDFITEFVDQVDRKIVLMIDEVDKSSNNQLFLDFLGLLREKYLFRRDGEDSTFHAVILAGVYDIKGLNIEIHRKETDQKGTLNNPWNIAADFKVALHFQPEEIEIMLTDYSQEKKVTLDIPEMAERLFYYTSGYPFLVSKLCKIMDEELMDKSEWNLKLLEQAVQQLLYEENTNFESLIKNIENNPNLSLVIQDCLIDGNWIEFNTDNSTIKLGVLHGIFRNEGRRVKIHNRIYKQIIYNYLISKIQTSFRHNQSISQDQFLEKMGI